MNIGNRIRSAREAAGMTQAEVAEQLDVSEASVRLYELGKRTPKPDMVARIAKVVGVAPQSLEEHPIESSRDALELLFRLEDACSLEPHDDGTLSIDRKAKNAKKLSVAIKSWAGMREDLKSGKITQEEYDAWKAKFA